jgi:hypothetical protein
LRDAVNAAAALGERAAGHAKRQRFDTDAAE